MVTSNTSLAGYIGLAATVLAAIGAAFSGTKWGQILLALGIALKGSDSVGNVLSQDQFLSPGQPRGQDPRITVDPEHRPAS